MRKLILINLFIVYLVIAAGSIVRMTGSGMGCPDWPKCFGYLIPPTERAQLDWKPLHDYHKDEVIIVEQTLRVALRDFTSTTTYTPVNWGPYTKHDYAVFNVYHTWIEFINRLLGAIAGLGTLILFVFTLVRIKSAPFDVFWAMLVLFGMGFQAWLGKTVVDSNLLPLKITIHMAMAFLLLAFLLLLLFRNSERLQRPQLKKFTPWIGAALVVTVLQISMGTQVRQFIDLQMHRWVDWPNKWLDPAPILFYIHRSFSLIVLLLHIYIGWQVYKLGPLPKLFITILALIAANILTGIAMYYVDFPWGSQPLHLVLSALLFGLQFYFLLLCYHQKKEYDL